MLTRKMTRRIIGIVLTVALIVSSVALAVTAATAVDTSHPGSLCLTYSYDGQSFAGIDVSIYHVADITRYGEYSLSGAFADLPVEVNNIKTQDEWNQVASTLSAYVTAKEILPDGKSTTDENGTVSFGEIPLGLYMVAAVRIEGDTGYYVFDQFMISLPDLDDEDKWVYDVVAKPKSVFQEFEYEDITYHVNKLWKDEGYAHKRPQSIDLELYCNGTLTETVTLSAENNWNYSWTAKDDGSIWQVVETDVAEGYTVTMEQSEASFTVINSYEKPEIPPVTGDVSNIDIYLWIICAAGLGLIVLGVTGRRRKSE